MDKLVHDSRGTTISNDGATIMKARGRCGAARRRLGLAARAAPRRAAADAAARLRFPRRSCWTSCTPPPKRWSTLHAARTRRRVARGRRRAAAAPRAPAARSRAAPPRQVGDGTTTVVLLAGEFLREAKPFIEDGVHPQLIIKAFRTAATLGVEAVRNMSVRCACSPRARAAAARRRGRALAAAAFAVP